MTVFYESFISITAFITERETCQYSIHVSTTTLLLPTDDIELPKPVMRGLEALKGKRKLFEAPKPHYYYHLEYKLFPTDTEPMKADVVTYGVAAKIYSESDSKVLKTWREGGKTWVTWTHRLDL